MHGYEHKPGLDERATAPGPTAALHELAQQKAKARAARSSEELNGLSPEATRNVLHELHVHQLELEMQNEELRRTHQELEESRARYLDLYEHAPMGYLTISDKGVVMEANLTSAALLDVPMKELIEQPWTRFILTEDQNIFARHSRALHATGVSEPCELRLHRGGGWFWARLDARMAYGADGARSSRTALCDITVRKHAVDALAASEARHRVLFENSHDARMTLAPPEWRFTSGNAATIAMFGAIDEQDFVTRTPWDYSPKRQPDGRRSEEKARAMMEECMRVGGHSFEWTYLRAPGVEFRATVVLARMEINDEPLVQATVRDESEAQKQHGILAQTERLASMGMLAASVGHEINNPLAYVLANVDLLAQSLPRVASAGERCLTALRGAVGDAAFAAIVGDDADVLAAAALNGASELARDALDGAQRITRISRALSTFSRVDSDESVAVDLVHAIECAITMADNQIRFRAKLVRDLCPVPAVWGSEGKLSQVFLNLLINASHAMTDGPIEGHCITVRTWKRGADVCAEVSDTGKGIPPENMVHIFEPFFSTKRIGVGSGLGLSICRNLIIELGGDIHVESVVGKGTRFEIRLPAWTEESSAPRTEPPSSGVARPARKGRILVVDDEAPLRMMIGRLLVRHELVVAASAEDARVVLERDDDFDLVLCDLMMPKTTGMELHRWLKERNPTLAERVVFITGGAFGAMATEYLTQCGNLTIHKPFDNETFRRVVAERVRSSPCPARA